MLDDFVDGDRPGSKDHHRVIGRVFGAEIRLEVLEKPARALGSDLIVGVSPGIAYKRITSLVASGHAVIRKAS